MPQNLFAACRVDGALIAKRIRLDNTVQEEVEAIFATQEADFIQGIEDEIPFDGSWHPDDDELLTVDIPEEAEIFSNAVTANAVSIPLIDTDNFSQEGIKAIFTGRGVEGATKVLVQRFTSQQVLERKFALFQQGNAFRRLSAPAFSLDTSLTCIIEGGKIKFKSQQKMRSIINMLDIYRAATDQEVRSFASHSVFRVASTQDFVDATNQTARKLINSISNSGVLQNYTATGIQAAARETGLVIDVQQGKISMPVDRSQIKSLLQFLNESRYLGPLSGQTYVTNSRRPA